MIKTQIQAGWDLLIILGISTLGLLCYPFLLPLFNHPQGFGGVLLMALLEFIGAGLGAFVVILFRREKLSNYGVQGKNLGNSLLFGLIISIIIVVAYSFQAGELLWFPMARHSATRVSLTLPLPLNVIGIAITYLDWGMIEGFYFICIAKKLGDFAGFTPKNIWLSPGPILFAVYDFQLHYIIHFIDRRGSSHDFIGVISSFLIAYFITIIPNVTKNAWGGMLIETIQNGLGKP